MDRFYPAECISHPLSVRQVIDLLSSLPEERKGDLLGVSVEANCVVSLVYGIQLKDYVAAEGRLVVVLQGI
jgi:hypothetical protein